MEIKELRFIVSNYISGRDQSPSPTSTLALLSAMVSPRGEERLNRKERTAYQLGKEIGLMS
jgi:hypothetical protein